MKIAFDWGFSSYFGWGVYGINLALEWANDPDIEAQCTYGIRLDHVALDPLRHKAIEPFITRSAGKPSPDTTIFRCVGNEFTFCGTGAPEIREPPICAIFFEWPLSPLAIERAKRSELIITGSTWNEEVLRGYGVDNVKTIFQGVDRSLFHPAPRRGLFPGKFLIFSGGKAEPRKGQDLVVKAFRAFASRHRDAMLVTAWASPWPQLREGMDLDLTGFEDQVIHLGPTANGRMASVYAECDVALFPNRAEGGTNLVAMECIACGVPTILSTNTGHLDLLELDNTIPLARIPNAAGIWSEWGESSIDNIVEVLEIAYRNQWVAANGMPSDKFRWDVAASELAAIARNHNRSHHERQSRKVEA